MSAAVSIDFNARTSRGCVAVRLSRLPPDVRSGMRLRVTDDELVADAVVDMVVPDAFALLVVDSASITELPGAVGEGKTP